MKSKAKATKAKATKKKVVGTRQRKPKLVENASVIKDGQIYCVNHKENTTPFWGGKTCDEHQPDHGNLARWVCSKCVQDIMPAPAPLRSVTPPAVDPTTGEVIKRKRGRPRTKPEKPVELGPDGEPIKRKRGRPAGAKNKATIEKEALIKEGKLAPEPKRGRGRPKGSKNKVTKSKSVSKKKTN